MRKFILILFSISLFSCKNEKEKNEKNTNTNIQNEKIPVATKIQNPKSELENEIIKLLKAFKTKDEKTLNSYIDTNIGFYLIPGPGTLLNFKKTDEISFSDANVSYHKFGSNETHNYKPIYENPPTYDCETYKWSKEGLFIDKERVDIFTSIVENPLNKEYDISFSKDEVAEIKQMEKISTQVYLTEKDGDIVFGIAKYNGKYIITFLNFSPSYCDV